MKINLSKKNYIISAGADGLGFAIANKIISDHDGNIEFQSKKGGAKIKIIFNR